VNIGIFDSAGPKYRKYETASKIGANNINISVISRNPNRNDLRYSMSRLLTRLAPKGTESSRAFP
jgi:hypothetical protein